MRQATPLRALGTTGLAFALASPVKAAPPGKPAGGEPPASTAPSGSSAEGREAPARSERTSLGFLGWSGVAAMILGTGALGAGAGIVAYQSRPQSCDADEDGAGQSCEPAEVTKQPEGWILLGAGAALFTVGLVRVLIDRPKRSRTAAAPVVGRRAAGVALSVRF